LVSSIKNPHNGYLKTYSRLFNPKAKIELKTCGSANPWVEHNAADAFKKALPDADVWGWTGLTLFGKYAAENQPPYTGWFTPGYSGVPFYSEWTKVEPPRKR
jgi:hypothetical protein